MAEDAPAEDAPTNEKLNAPRIMRCFLAVEGNAAVAATVGAAQAALRRRGGPADLPVRWTHPADAHLTLQFFGNVLSAHLPEIVAAATPVAARHAPFLLRLGAGRADSAGGAGGVGAFPDVAAPRVLWLDLVGQTDALHAVQRDLAATMLTVSGVVADRQAFRPHLTLGRVMSGRDAAGTSVVANALARPFALPPTPWPVARFVLMRSLPGGTARGKRYTVLHGFGLREDLTPGPSPSSGEG